MLAAAKSSGRLCRYAYEMAFSRVTIAIFCFIGRKSRFFLHLIIFICNFAASLGGEIPETDRCIAFISHLTEAT